MHTLAFKFWKKRWDREESFFELQEWGASESERGFATIVQDKKKLRKEDCVEYFKPGKSYRLLSKSVETGQMTGVVWKHYEPIPGALPKPLEKPQPSKKEPPKRPHDYMGEYVKEVKETLEPISDLFDMLDELRGGFFGKEEQQPASATYPIPPLQYQGAAPWVLHPQVVQTVGNEIKGIVDHVAERIFGEESTRAASPRRGAEPATEAQPPAPTLEGDEEDLGLPDIHDYAQKEESTTAPPEEPSSVVKVEVTEPSNQQEQEKVEEPEVKKSSRRRKKNESA